MRPRSRTAGQQVLHLQAPTSKYQQPTCCLASRQIRPRLRTDLDGQLVALGGVHKLEALEKGTRRNLLGWN